MSTSEIAAFLSTQDSGTIVTKASSSNLQDDEDDDNYSSQTAEASLAVLDRARHWIYISHFFAQFSDAAWQFSISLFMAALSNYKSLFLVSSYGIVSQLSVCAFGAASGRLVDQTSARRLMTARLFLGTQTVCVLIATVCSYYALNRVQQDDYYWLLSTTTAAAQLAAAQQQETNETLYLDPADFSSTPPPPPPTNVESLRFAWWHDRITVSLVVLIHLFGPLSEILDQAFLVAMERDWIVAMAPSTTLTCNACIHNNNGADGGSSMQSQEHHSCTNASTSNSTHQKHSHDRAWLAETNVRMKQLDLTCKIVAPAVAGWVVGAFEEHNHSIFVSPTNNNNYSNNYINGTMTLATPDDELINNNSDNNNNVHENDKTPNLTTAALLVGLINVAAVIVEYVATARVYSMVPALRRKNRESPKSGPTTTRTAMTRELSNQDETSTTGGSFHKSSLKQGDSNNLNDGSGRNSVHDDNNMMGDYSRQQNLPELVEEDEADVLDMEDPNLVERLMDGGNNTSNNNASAQPITGPSFLMLLLPSGWRVYFEQPIAYGGLGLAVLYVNALTFGALMTAYLASRGMALGTVGLLRGLSAALGLLGTVAYHVSVSSTSLVITGLWSIVFEFLCLGICFASFFVQSYNGSMALLVAGVWASRIGLWVFDISITQMMQELIPEGIRGVVGGTQQSLNALFQFTSYALGLIFFDPADFYIYAGAGYLAVGIALVLYFVGVFQRANDLFPPPPPPPAAPSSIELNTRRQHLPVEAT
ncbi:hypothetical protein ACA910_002009 [Epithemia clementina (nom. ined.)]